MKKAGNYLSIILPVVVILFLALGFLLAPNDPMHVDVGIKFLESGGDYPLGTDEMGRCIFSRLLYGGRTTLGIVLVGSLMVLFLGVFFGVLMAGGGHHQNTIIWESLLNAVTAVPPIAYLIVFIGAWGNGIATMLIALTASLSVRLIKLVKTEAELELQKAYILCAVASGASKKRVMLVHVVPNLLPDVIRFLCLSGGEMILAITGFSFIGLGMGDTVIDWGMMVADARSVLLLRPELMLYPIAAIIMCTFSFNLLAQKVGH